MRKIEEKITKIQEDTLEHYRNSISRGRYNEDMEKVRGVLKVSEPSAPDFILVKRLSELYHPLNKGFINSDEISLVSTNLELDHRTTISLHNLRNTVVMMSDLLDSDRVSAITTVIDGKLLDRGTEF